MVVYNYIKFCYRVCLRFLIKSGVGVLWWVCGVEWSGGVFILFILEMGEMCKWGVGVITF